jgi:flagellar hook-basal body complex protein FliE
MNLSLKGISQSVPFISAGAETAPIKNNNGQNLFAGELKAAIAKINDAQKISDEKTAALTAGNIENLHDVMITAQKANLTLETAVQVQQKMIDAYNEIMRMQV